MGEPNNPQFYDFGIFGRVPEPQNQYYLPFETAGYLKEIMKTSKPLFENIMFVNPKMSEI